MSWTSGSHQQSLQQSLQQIPAQMLPPPVPVMNLSSQFHLFPMIEAISDAVERGVRDQHIEDLVNEFANRYEKCQQVLAQQVQSSKQTTLKAQKQKLHEYENQLKLRREALLKYKDMVDNLTSFDG